MQKNFYKLITILTLIFVIGVFFSGLDKSSVYDTKKLVGYKLTNINLNHFSENRIITEKDLNKNTFTLINFWSSWCKPCRDEHVFLLKLNNEKNLQLLGVNFKDKKKHALKFLNDLGNPYDDIAFDEFGKESINFGIYGIPESILVNRDLIIIKKFVGPISYKDFEYIKRTIESL